MTRAVIQDTFGGTDVLELRDVPEQHAEPGQVRVRVAAVGLNPVDWKIAGNAQIAERYGLQLPTGFGNDFAGTIDEVGDGVESWTIGDRVYGGARGRAVAEQIVIDLARDTLRHTPDGVDDATAATLDIAGRTAAAVIDTVGLGEGDTVLVGGAAGGVGVYTVQLARRRGARVLGTASASGAGTVREFGGEPVEYGDGLVDRVRALAPDGIDAAIDLVGTESALAGLELGVPGHRIATIAAYPPVEGTSPTGGAEASASALDDLAAAIAAGEIRMPIIEFPLDRIRDAVDLQRDGHVHGKVVITI